MKIRDISIGDLTEIQLSARDGDSFEDVLETDKNYVLQYQREYQEWILSNGSKHWRVAGAGLLDQDKLMHLRESSNTWVSFLAGTVPLKGVAKRAIIGIRSFPHFTLLPADYIFQICISDEVMDSVRKRIIRQNEMANKDVITWLTQHTLFERGEKPAMLMTAGASLEVNDLISFVVYGDKFSLTVKKIKEIYLISKVTKRTQPNINDAIHIIAGGIEFRDVSISSHYAPSGNYYSPIDAMVSENSGSYLQLWNQYNQFERDIVIRRARKYGWLHYDKCLDFSDGWRLFIKDMPRNREKIESLCNLEEITLEVSKNLPKELSANLPYTEDGWENEEEQARGVVVSCIRFDSSQCIIDVELFNSDAMGIMAPPKDGGYLYVSIIGDRQRLIRRQVAWKKIKDLRTGIPGLKYLLEQPVAFASRDYHPIKISDEEIINAFSGIPTPKQLLAVRIAINTPDIAVIQGPPGTGKTRVISALNKLLNSPKLSGNFQKGKILLTSYQHDAVENVADHTSVCGLPVFKFGKRKKQDENLDPITDWRKKQINILKEDPFRSLDRPVLDVLQNIQKLVLGYSVKPTTPLETVSMLKEVMNLAYNCITPELIAEYDELANKIRRDFLRSTVAEEEQQRRLRSAVDGLRTDETSFMDDGPLGALILLERMKNQDLLSGENQDLLLKASQWEMESPLDFLAGLAELRQQLLDKLVTHRLPQTILPNADVENLLNRTIKHIQESVEIQKDDPELIVRRFIDDLEFDPGGISLAVQGYSMTIAATCQYAGSINVSKFIEQEETNFDTVIVDEAARANPLDLLIPISMAKRRAILLGDQRQLPHILEPDVEKQLNQSTAKTQEELRESLFNRLFNTLGKLGQDAPASRIITLDMQFRMHPILGQFVSDTFYKKHHQEFRSDHLKVEEFQHNIELYKGKVAVWKDIPASRGLEEQGISKRRIVEAKWVAEEAHRILQIDDKITVGVISFYAGQVEEILGKMIAYGLAEDTEGIIQISRGYQQKIDGMERLRVGTVDAFQGKEFDVVILSMTRCNHDHSEVDDIASQRLKYGFLTLENRLCVAMSRQKRLLIVAGDLQMINCPAAEQALPGLVEFSHLCEGEHGLFIRHL